MSANKAFLMLLSLSSITLVGLTAVLIKIVPMLFSHAVYVCQKTFTNVIFALSHSLPLFLVTLIMAILLIGTLALAVQILKTRKYLKANLSKKILVSKLFVESTIEELNLNSKIDIVEDNNKFSFCYGLLRPKICLSTGLLKDLTKIELKAVLLHESYHLKNNDPLKILLGKTSAIMFFFIPLLRDIQSYYAFSKEIAADEVVIRNGNKHSLISVLSKLMVSPSPKFAIVATLTNVNDLEKRILYLSGKQIKNTFKPSVANIFISVLVVVFSLMIVNAPVYAVNTNEDSSVTSCKAEKEINFSRNMLYTPNE